MTNSVSFEDVSEAGNSSHNEIQDSKQSSHLHSEVDYSKAKKFPIFFAAIAGETCVLSYLCKIVM